MVILGLDPASKTERTHMKIIINAIPVAQPRQRHRVIQSGGRAFASNYTPKNDPVNTFKAACQMTVSELQIPLIDEPVMVDFVFVMPRPKKFDAKKFGDGRLPHGSKPDRDNLLKSCQDALNGILWRDDSLIYSGKLEKRYAAKNESPHVEITIVDQV
jgi:Holliday junction resolvase RusA-like endonuclease